MSAEPAFFGPPVVRSAPRGPAGLGPRFCPEGSPGLAYAALAAAAALAGWGMAR